MGEVIVKLELENFADREMARRGMIEESEVRHIESTAMVDTGAVMLVLPQDQVEALGLIQTGTVIVRYADERKEERPVAGVVTVRYGNRTAQVECIVGPPASEPLLGQIPLERMDLLVDCVHQTLTTRPESQFLPTLKLK